uniref:Putative proteasome-type protease n=1 Tax=Candidatus Kentrum eta TaxID=2126337 RepID=A0A450VGV6_9GAMM|nr:MAG: putative proteasome-type protease [Candidatus Kentron sp. H]VFJ98715.1 MAG: putative proteasome-type protease [Candidatus Kentron sp. H]VFK03957.1 MAG: putative proteasome-type protease [Candidatus Kentron sp. H]
MTYCVGISLKAGLVFASDSRTNAGSDHVNSYSKMHTFGIEGKRQFVILSAGNLATTQAVLTHIFRELRDNPDSVLSKTRYMSEVADYIGEVSRERQNRMADGKGAMAGFSPSASFILGGQILGEPASLRLIYPEGNHITTSPATRYLQIGEIKYGKPILDRIIEPDISLEDAVRCALVSMDSTMQSNVTVGPPIETLIYERDSFTLKHYMQFCENHPYLQALRGSWAKNIRAAFSALPPFDWESMSSDAPTCE